MEFKTATGYARVSTKKQKDEGESLENQEKAIRSYCENNNIKLIGMYKEAYSGKKSIRPILNEAIYNSKINKVDYFVIFDIDRFSREGVEAYKSIKNSLENVGVQLKDCKNILQDSTFAIYNEFYDMSKYAWNKVNPSEYAETILSLVAEEEGKKILQRTIGREIQLEQEGYHIRPANYGFKNIKIDTPKGKRPIQVLDEIEGPYVIEIFNLLAEGILSDFEIVEQINNKGCLKRKRIINRNGKKITVHNPMDIKYMREIIRNPIYAGVNNSKWTGRPIKTAYKGLVSIETWNKANKGEIEIIEDKDGINILYSHKGESQINKQIAKKQKLDDNDFLFGGIIKYISNDGKKRAMRVSKTKGNVYYKHSKNQKPSINISQKQIVEELEKKLPDYNLPEFLIKPFREGLLEYFDMRNEKLIIDKNKLEEEIKEIKEENEKLIREKISGSNVEIINGMLEKNDEKILTLKSDLQKKERTQRNLSNKVAQLLEMYLDRQKYFVKSDNFRKKVLIRLMIAQLEISYDKDNKKLLHIVNTEQFDIINKINYYTKISKWQTNISEIHNLLLPLFENIYDNFEETMRNLKIFQDNFSNC